MKLTQLIARLQEIEKSKPGVDVVFRLADVNANGFTNRDLHHLKIDAVSEGKGYCLITLGDYESDDLETAGKLGS